jgi:hypothetical protein
MAACNNFQVFQYENFDAAGAFAHQAPSEPPMYRETAPPADLPAFVVYAQVAGDFHGGSEGSQMRALEREVRERRLAPDFMLYASRGAANVGTVTQHIGLVSTRVLLSTARRPLSGVVVSRRATSVWPMTQTR